MANTKTKIYLCNVNFRPNHQLRWNTVEEQNAFFASKIVSSHPNCNYQDRLGVMKISGYVDTMINTNYGFYENEYNGTTKRFYFWILEHHFKSKNTTELVIQLDAVQTWYFNYSMDTCFVERMHVDSNDRYNYCLAEDFELGDYVVRKRVEIEELKDTCLLLFVSDNTQLGYRSGKSYNALKCYYYQLEDSDMLSSKLQTLMDIGAGDSIAYISIFPNSLLVDKISGIASGDIISNSTLITKQYTYQHSDFFSTFSFKEYSYTPFNKKLLQYPFNFIMLKNASGSNVVLKFEQCDNNAFVFNLETLITPDAKCCLSPRDYEGKDFSYEDGILTDSYGLCSWNNDNYANWYASHVNTIISQSKNSYSSLRTNSSVNQNTYDNAMYNRNANLARNVVSTGSSILQSAGSMNVAGAIGSGISGVANAGIDYFQSLENANTDLTNSGLMTTNAHDNTIRSLVASVQDAKVQPNTAKGDTSGIGLDVARESNTIYIDQIQIKPEFAQRIDNFLQMYGILINDVTRPYINTRSKWNYIKTVNARALGGIPEADKLEIERLYNGGVTFWSSQGDIGNYFQTNEIT